MIFLKPEKIVESIIQILVNVVQFLRDYWLVWVMLVIFSLGTSFVVYYDQMNRVKIKGSSEEDDYGYEYS